MKHKGFVTLGLAAGLSVLTSMSAFAGEWKVDSDGCWYQNDDGSYPQDGWKEIDGKYYYFQPDGYILRNTITPDEYVVGLDGAWIPNETEESLRQKENERANHVQDAASRFADVSKYFNTDLQDYEKAKAILNVQPYSLDGGVWYEELIDNTSEEEKELMKLFGEDNDENEKYLGYCAPTSLYHESSKEYYKQNSFRINYDVNTNQIISVSGDPELFINGSIDLARDIKPIAEEAGATNIVYQNEDSTTTAYRLVGGAFVPNGTKTLRGDRITFTWNNLKYSYSSHEGRIGGDENTLIISRN